MINSEIPSIRMENLYKKYIFNPYYTIKNDQKRVVLLNSSSYWIPDNIAEDGISVFIHPVFAIAFSLFDGKNSLEFCLNKISKLFESTFEESYNFILPFIENKKRIGIEYANNWFEFPKNILLYNDNQEYPIRKFNYEQYFIDEELDFKTTRLLHSPTTINLLVNTKCITDCIYCYVQRDNKIDCQIPIEKLFEIIDNAKQLNIINFDICGTEFFLYKNWKILLKKLLENGYYPYLSTKIPLSKEDLQVIKEIGINDLQFSIDTIHNNKAKIVNNVKIDNYTNEMFKTLKETNKLELKITINSVITKYNSNKNDIKLLLDKISENVNIEKITINPAEISLYCKEEKFNDFKLSIEEIIELEKFIEEIKDNYYFKINFAGYEDIDRYKKPFPEREKLFNERSVCSGNISQFCILPDGQVTICEELYWQPKFIIGNILNNSISEIWQSKKALNLFNISQNEISKHSPCKTCNDFTTCRQNQGICWSDALTSYGIENWDFPSSNCPYAPFPYHKIYHE